jgi:hypothetical protein
MGFINKIAVQYYKNTYKINNEPNFLQNENIFIRFGKKVRFV